MFIPGKRIAASVERQGLHKIIPSGHRADVQVEANGSSPSVPGILQKFFPLRFSMQEGSAAYDNAAVILGFCGRIAFADRFQVFLHIGLRRRRRVFPFEKHKEEDECPKAGQCDPEPPDDPPKLLFLFFFTVVCQVLQGLLFRNILRIPLGIDQLFQIDTVKIRDILQHRKIRQRMAGFPAGDGFRGNIQALGQLFLSQALLFSQRLHKAPHSFSVHVRFTSFLCVPGQRYLFCSQFYYSKGGK